MLLQRSNFIITSDCTSVYSMQVESVMIGECKISGSC